MERFIGSIERSLQSENWFGALFLALAIPDVCGALETPGVGNGKRYKRWFNQNMAPLYQRKNPIDPAMLARLGWTDEKIARTQAPLFNADDCYAFRCSCLHAGMTETVRSHIHFVAPPGNGNIVHLNLIDDVLQMQIDQFCLEVCRATRKWLVDVSGEADVQERMRKLITVYHL